jgi:hypothetical protein
MYLLNNVNKTHDNFHVSGFIISKVKLSQWLTKYHAMKTFPVLYQAPRHGDVWGSGGIAARILNLCTRWRRVISFTPLLLYSPGKAPGSHGIRGWVGPRAGLDAVAKRKNPYPCQESKFGRPTHSVVTILVELCVTEINQAYSPVRSSHFSWTCVS